MPSYYMYQAIGRMDTATKIRHCLDEYERLHGKRPTLVLAHPSQVCEVPGVVIRPREQTQVDNFWLGWE